MTYKAKTIKAGYLTAVLLPDNEWAVFRHHDNGVVAHIGNMFWKHEVMALVWNTKTDVSKTHKTLGLLMDLLEKIGAIA